MKQKIIYILYILVLIIMLFSNKSFARMTEDRIENTVIYDVIHGGDSFLEYGDNREVQESLGITEDFLEDNLKDVSDTLYNVLVIIAIIAAVIMAAVLGIKFILGSIEEQAKVQKALVPYVIGCIVAFGAFTIWHFIVTIGNHL